MVVAYFSGFGIKSCCCEFQDGLQSIIDMVAPGLIFTSPLTKCGQHKASRPLRL